VTWRAQFWQVMPSTKSSVLAELFDALAMTVRSVSNFSFVIKDYQAGPFCRIAPRQTCAEYSG
jgi:hypothetical protein